MTFLINHSGCFRLENGYWIRTYADTSELSELINEYSKKSGCPYRVYAGTLNLDWGYSKFVEWCNHNKGIIGDESVMMDGSKASCRQVAAAIVKQNAINTIPDRERKHG